MKSVDHLVVNFERDVVAEIDEILEAEREERNRKLWQALIDTVEAQQLRDNNEPALIDR